ncbi:MAG: hypothetical protein V1647_03980 [Pseudomonadota bacterium]
MRKILLLTLLSTAVLTAADYEWSCYGLVALKNSSGPIPFNSEGVPTMDAKYIICSLNRDVEFMYKANGVMRKVPGVETVFTTGLINCTTDNEELLSNVKKVKKDPIKIIDYKDVADTYHYISYSHDTRQSLTIYDRTHNNTPTFEHHNIVYDETTGKNKDVRTIGTYIGLTKEVDGKRSHYIECDF